jgi:hypothetical protein
MLYLEKPDYEVLWVSENLGLERGSTIPKNNKIGSLYLSLFVFACINKIVYTEHRISTWDFIILAEISRVISSQ